MFLFYELMRQYMSLFYADGSRFTIGTILVFSNSVATNGAKLVIMTFSSKL